MRKPLLWGKNTLKKLLTNPRKNPANDAGLTEDPSIRELSRFLASIPGMIDVERCLFHMALAYGQTVKGDVVEIGAWQGRNSIALAAGCRASGNGKVLVIDHFRGNPGTETYYRVGREDLSDLLGNFQQNVARSGLGGWIEVFPIDRKDFSEQRLIRLLVVDGNHAYEAVKADLDHFNPMLAPGALVIMDDHSPEFPGVVQATAEFLNAHEGATAQQFGRGRVIRLPG